MRLPALELNANGTISNCEFLQCRTAVTGYRIETGPFDMYRNGLLLLKPGFTWPVVCSKGQLVTPYTMVPMAFKTALEEMQRMGLLATLESDRIRETYRNELARYYRTAHDVTTIPANQHKA